LTSGDSIEVVHRPEHGLTVADVAHIFMHDHGRADRLLYAAELPTSWLDWALSRVRKFA